MLYSFFINQKEIIVEIFRPKLLTCLKTYSKHKFVNDIIAGIIVAIIAMPLSIALAIASGLSPEKGLHTAIIGGFVISLLGGSRVQIGGPTGAFMVIIYGIVLQYGVEGMVTATFMAGIMIILMGIFKLGSMIKYIPYPVTSGFTTGIAVTILMSQVKDFFGLSIAEKMPAEFLSKITVYAKYFSTINYTALIISAASLALLIIIPKINKQIPAPLIVLILFSAIVKTFSLDVVTIDTAFSNLDMSLPSFSIPTINLEIAQKMFMPALAIAILGSIESLLSAVVADGLIAGKHRSNTELIAQGIANMASSLFGGMPCTGAIARTVANINNGGSTPIAGIVHAICLLIITLLFMPFAKMIPLATLSAILIMVAINMGDWVMLKKILSAPKSDAIILFAVFILTIVFDLVVAIEAGMILAAFLFMKRMATMTDVKISNLDAAEEEQHTKTSANIQNEANDSGIYVYEINGPFFFGAANKFTETLHTLDAKTKKLILRMRYVNTIDATAVHALNRMIGICKHHDIKIVICELRDHPREVLDKMGVTEIIGSENIVDNFDEIQTII